MKTRKIQQLYESDTSRRRPTSEDIEALVEGLAVLVQKTGWTFRTGQEYENEDWILYRAENPDAEATSIRRAVFDRSFRHDDLPF